MPDWVIPSIFIGVFGVGVVLKIVAGLYGNIRRRKSLEELAERLGWGFDRDASEGLGQIRRNFSLFQRGRHRKAYNLLTGSVEDVEVLVFDYRYRSGSGQSSHTNSQSVVGLRLPGVAIPGFELRQEGLFDRFAAWAGFEDIDFEGDPAFSDRYMLKGEDEPAIRKMFDQEARNHFVERADLKETLAGQGEYLLMYRPGRRLKPDQIEDAVSRATEALFALHLKQRPQAQA